MPSTPFSPLGLAAWYVQSLQHIFFGAVPLWAGRDFFFSKRQGLYAFYCRLCCMCRERVGDSFFANSFFATCILGDNLKHDSRRNHASTVNCFLLPRGEIFFL